MREKLPVAGLWLAVLVCTIVVGCSIPQRVTTTTGWIPGQPVVGRFIAGELLEPSVSMAYLFGLAGNAEGEFEGWRYFVIVKGHPTDHFYIFRHDRVSMEAEGTVAVVQERSIMWRRLSLRYETTSGKGGERFLLAGREYDLGSGRIFLVDMSRTDPEVTQLTCPLTVSYRPGGRVTVRWVWEPGKSMTHSMVWRREPGQQREFPGLDLTQAMDTAVSTSRTFLSDETEEVRAFVR